MSTALLLMVLLTGQPQRSTVPIPFDTQKALRLLQQTPASELDPRLPPTPLAKWLKAVLPASGTTGWTVGDCDEHWDAPEPASGYRICGKAFWRPRDPRRPGADTIKVLIVIGTTRAGLLAKPLFDHVLVQQNVIECTVVDRLGDLAAAVKKFR